MKLDWQEMKGPLLIVLLNGLISAGFLAFGRLPETVPLSWWDGEPLVMGARWALLLRVPALMLVLTLAIALGLRWDRTLTGRRRAGALGPILILMLAVMTYGHLRMLLLAASGVSHAAPAVGDIAVAGLALAGLGNHLAKTQSNGFYAFTFPWLRGHERAYLRTQRAAAWLFVAAGGAIILASPFLVSFPTAFLMALTPTAVVGISLVVTLASWGFSRSEPTLDGSR